MAMLRPLPFCGCVLYRRERKVPLVMRREESSRREEAGRLVPFGHALASHQASATRLQAPRESPRCSAWGFRRLATARTTAPSVRTLFGAGLVRPGTFLTEGRAR